MRKKIEWQWELIEEANEGRFQTYRAKLIGGWALLTVIQDMKMKVLSSSQVFIADRDHEWTIVPPIQAVEAAKPTVKADDFAPSK
jgi:hypothetical protein